MSYGKYGFKNSGNNIDYSNYNSLAYNDPWFALGNLLGNVYVGNFANRGDKKIYDQVSNELKFGGNDPTQNNATLSNIENNYKAAGLLPTYAGANVTETNPNIPTPTPVDNTARNKLIDDYAAKYGLINQSPSDSLNINPTVNVQSTPETNQNNTPVINPLTSTPTVMINGETPNNSNIVGNIDVTKQPIVQNPDGTVSTVRSMSANINGKEVLLPTVSQDGRILSNQEAIDEYKRTGRNLGVFNTVEEANNAAQNLHLQEQQRVSTQGNNTPINTAINPANPIQQLAAQAPKTQIPQGVINFDKDTYLSNKRMELAKMGIPENRINYLLENIGAQADAYDKKVKDNNASIAIGELIQLDPTSPVFQQKLIDVMKYNPDAAKILANNVINANQQWVNNEGIKKEGRTYNYGQAAANAQFGRQKELAADAYKRQVAIAQINANRNQQAQQAKIQEQVNLVKSAHPEWNNQMIAQYLLKNGINGRPAQGAGAIDAETKQKIADAKAILEDEKNWKAIAISNPKIGSYPYQAQADNARKFLMGRGDFGGGNNENNNSNNTSLSKYVNNQKDAWSQWTFILEDNSNLDPSKKLTRQQMIDKAKDHFGYYADDIIKNTNWEDYGL